MVPMSATRLARLCEDLLTSRRLYVVASVLTALSSIAVIAAAFVPRTTISEGSAAEFVGEIAGRRARLRLEFDASSVSGELEFPGESDFRLEGRLENGDNLRLAVSRWERRHEGGSVIYGELVGRLDMSRGVLNGTWTDSAGKDARAFLLGQTASGK